MSDIPEDVLEAAQAVVDDINLNDASAAPAIARAILAERERCARIAESMPTMVPASPAHVRGLKGSDVAEAIFSPKPFHPKP